MRALLFFVIALSGCGTASLVRVQEAPRGGVVKMSWPFTGAYTAREKARDLMEDFCWPQDFQMVGVGATPKVELSMLIEKKGLSGSNEPTKEPFVFFQCREPVKRASK